ncbi:tetraspanin-11 isoform X1 [Eumetopias jubatus]|uniref:tetraspanin-11 isoform X1 n=1 Tax=Eumetopias jubatus TaxID=34886 RepID=UPI001016A4B3|nr:tetraspanin-11 isoform X1 [Eumetopias jubatus]
MAHYKAEQDDWLIVYLKYLLFVFNFFFWVGGAAVMAVGVWTLVEKSGYLSVLASSTFAASAYILIFAGALVMVTGFLGFGAIIREDRSCLSTYFCLLLVIFLVELVAGVLAHMYYQRLSDELKQHLSRTLAENYRQPGASDLTTSVDRLQQDFKCCGSNSSADWQHSAYILSREAEGRRVPDSCCKTVVARCGQRAHPSNIYKVEGGCITKLEQFLADHLLLMGAVGIGVACLQGNLRPSVHQMSFNLLCVLELTLVMGRRRGRRSPIRKRTDHNDRGPVYLFWSVHLFFEQTLPCLPMATSESQAQTSGLGLHSPESCLPMVSQHPRTIRHEAWLSLHVLLQASPRAGCSRG